MKFIEPVKRCKDASTDLRESPVSEGNFNSNICPKLVWMMVFDSASIILKRYWQISLDLGTHQNLLKNIYSKGQSIHKKGDPSLIKLLNPSFRGRFSLFTFRSIVKCISSLSCVSMSYSALTQFQPLEMKKRNNGFPQ